MKHIHLTIVLLFTTLGFIAHGQEEEIIDPKIELLGRAQKDHITLRWAPNTAELWKQANEYGMHLERHTIIRDGKTLPTPELKTYPNLFKPLPLEEWEKISEDDDYALVAAQAIHGESFDLTEDMSSDISRAINQTKELEQRHLFALFAADQSKDVALASGLMLEDYDVKENEKYLYSISCPLPPDIPAIDTGYVYLGLEDYFELPAPTGVKAETQEGNIILSWECRRFSDFYNSFIVERSNDDGKTFESITSTPIVSPLNDRGEIPEYMFKGDTAGQLQKAYLYRVKGINPFGEISPPSKTVSATINPKLNAQPRIINAFGMEDGSMQILWDFPEAQRDSIEGFKLKRSDKINGQYTVLENSLKATDSLTIDPNPLPSNYYLIVAFDQFGNESLSLPFLGMLEDSIPPAPPTGLIGSIDSSGILSLKWKSNLEEDVIGYRVYEANFKNEEFIQITNEAVLDTTYTDSIFLNTLNHQLFYKITAIDGHFNPSGFSETITVERPDFVAPAPAQFTNITSEEEGIQLSWTPSISDDIASHTIFRKSKDDDGWKPIASFKSEEKTSSFVDENIVAKTQYAYLIVAKDKAGNESTLSKPVTIASSAVVAVLEIEQVKAKADRTARAITITWKHEAEEVHKYLVYRAVKGEKLSLLKEVASSEKTFLDKKIEANTKYIYRVQAAMNSGALSAFSKELQVNY